MTQPDGVPDPDVVLELDLFPFQCQDLFPDQSQAGLQGVADLVKAAVPFGEAARALAVCFSRPDFDGRNILTVGLWADDGGATKEQLQYEGYSEPHVVEKKNR